MNKNVRLDCKMCGLKMYDTKTTEVWVVLDDDEGSDMPNLWRTEKDDWHVYHYDNFSGAKKQFKALKKYDDITYIEYDVAPPQNSYFNFSKYYLPVQNF